MEMRNNSQSTSLSKQANKKHFAKRFIRTLLPLLTICFALSLHSCNDDDDIVTEYDTDKHYTDNQPIVDEVKTSYNGKVVVLQPNADNIITYLSKRLTNTTTTLVSDADVVVLDDTKAQEILNNETDYKTLRKLWRHNKVLVFINPDRNTYLLEEHLKQSDPQATVASPSDEDLAAFKNIHIYATRADGTSLYHDDISSTTTIQSETSSISEGNLTETLTNEVSITPSPNDYNHGRVAENIATWLNEHATIGEQLNVALVRSGDSYSVTPTTITRYTSITKTHDWLKKHCKNATVPSPTTVETKTQIKVYGVYSTDTNCDVYDVNIYEEFPADKTYIENVYVYEHLAYNYKYTGGCYYGPEIDLRLKDIPESDISVEEAAPLPATDGQYNNTHYPMQLGFGTSLQGTISSEPGISVGFSMSCQLPYTTTSFNHAEMPIAFANDNRHAHWTYTADCLVGNIYYANWGFNPDFQDIPDIVHNFCHTDQAVTFIVSNTKSYGEKDMTLLLDQKWRLYDEYADPWGHCHSIYTKSTSNINIKLPKVNRYFEKYTPYPLPGYSGMADAPEWGNLEDRLMRSINYKALCDENLMVGAQTESELDKTAENIWREALEELVNRYNGDKTSEEYVIALGRSNGTHISLGLHIKDGVWSIVEDVDNITQ